MDPCSGIVFINNVFLLKIYILRSPITNFKVADYKRKGRVKASIHKLFRTTVKIVTSISSVILKKYNF